MLFSLTFPYVFSHEFCYYKDIKLRKYTCIQYSVCGDKLQIMCFRSHDPTYQVVFLINTTSVIL